MAPRNSTKADSALHSSDPLITKTQLSRQHLVTKKQVDALVHLGYLFPIRLGPRMVRFWRQDAEAGVQAFKARKPAPNQTKFARASIDWEA